MFDYSTQLVTALKSVLPTYHELALISGLKTPCISYSELNNYVEANGDTLGYSKITYQVKVWGTDMELIQKYAVRIDGVLRPLGFTRTSTNELYDRNSAMIQKILTFEANALETFN
jgi:hypothetical protein